MTVRSSENERGGRPVADQPRAILALALLEALEQPVVLYDAHGRLVLANPAAQEISGSPERPDADAWPALLSEAGHQVTRVALHDATGGPLGEAFTVAGARGDDGGDQLRQYASDIETLTEVGNILSELQDPDEAAAMICTVATGATGAIAVLLWERTGEAELVLRHNEGLLGSSELAELACAIQTEALGAFGGTTTVIHSPPATPGVLAMFGLDADAAAQAPPLTAWHEPLLSGGHSAGVLSIVWTGLVEDLERPRTLIVPLAHHAGIALDRADLLRQLGEAARTDALTGLANRRVWAETIERELSRAERSREPMSIVLIDIDHFKRYNDTFGHPDGDALLREASEAWAQQLRPADVLARVGGEEFAVLLPGCGVSHALCVAERLRTSVPRDQTCSLGIAEWDGHASSTELYQTADAALYGAKHGGRNRAVVADAGVKKAA
jgi:diguanylate cyclase (GGDEF)-like protein